MLFESSFCQDSDSKTYAWPKTMTCINLFHASVSFQYPLKPLIFSNFEGKKWNIGVKRAWKIIFLANTQKKMKMQQVYIQFFFPWEIKLNLAGSLHQSYTLYQIKSFR